MKKILLTISILFLGLAANAEIMIFESNLNMDNIWEKTGRYEQKVLEVGQRILFANKIDKRIAFSIDRTNKIVNAFAYGWDKTVVITTGIMQYMQNDDELAAVLAHEIAHTADQYGGLVKMTSMTFNRKQYELKADIAAVDLMVKAGYNPIAIIILDNKFMGEVFWDFGMFSSHPKTSKRLMEVYKYIYKKYPQYLNSSMTNDMSYQNFLITADKDIKAFKQKEKERTKKREANDWN